MSVKIGLSVFAMGSLLAAGLVVSPSFAGGHQGAPHGGGGGAHASAPMHSGGTAYRPSAPGGHAATAHRTANGTAHYGYGGYYGYGHGGYYSPYWGGWWYPWWGVGWYGGWWGGYWPGYAYAYYPSGYDDDTYVANTGPSHSQEPAVVETKVTPTSAEVTLDGDAVGFASDYNGRWDQLRVAPGRHAIVFRAKGYRSLTIDFEARPGAKYVLSDALMTGDGEDSRTLPGHAEPAPQASSQAAYDPTSRPPANGRLRVHAEPGDAAVYLDGEYLGLAAELARIHGALAVPVGSHRLEAARPGYASAVRTFDVGESEIAQVDIVLESQR